MSKLSEVIENFMPYESANRMCDENSFYKIQLVAVKLAKVCEFIIEKDQNKPSFRYPSKELMQATDVAKKTLANCRKILEYNNEETTCR